MEEEGDHGLAEERTSGAPQVKSLSCFTCSFQIGGESCLPFSHMSLSPEAPRDGFLDKAPGQRQVSLPSPKTLKCDLSFQDWPVWY